MTSSNRRPAGSAPSERTGSPVWERSTRARTSRLAEANGPAGERTNGAANARGAAVPQDGHVPGSPARVWSRRASKGPQAVQR